MQVTEIKGYSVKFPMNLPIILLSNNGGSNISHVTMFILQGFSIEYLSQVVLFIVFLLIYLLSIMTNVLIICIVKMAPHLHKPMYFFLSNFAFLEIWYISVTVPKMLSDFLTQKKTISVKSCMMQFYLFFLFGSTENFLLAAMSFDRYVAICYPLRYLLIMNESFCRLLAAGAWIISVIAMTVVMIPITRLSFCGSNVIDHVFCDFSPLVKIACQGVKLSEVIFFFLAGLVSGGCFILIIASYTHIILTVLSTSSASRLRNAFTTCASHFLVIFIYYGTVIFIYMRPSASISFQVDKVVSVFYSALTPLLNPLIYSLRNKEVREAIQNILANRLSKRKGC
ncbi:olfactory receptor 6-like [Bombina bombina]|uniref:olfactory receptor 6-like n=1 Tax=Bombina bombina TaxID=8345 RepID=UPI00235A7BFC|nr:olfactory receptor 6-like [Bombina bombina]